MTQPNDTIKLNFSYEDEFGYKTDLNKTIPIDCYDSATGLDILIDEFKLFLIACTFSAELVDKIQIADEEE